MDAAPGDRKGPDRAPGAGGLAGTKLRIAEAALETLKSMGFAGASARAIAHQGEFNQALIFYHFGSVQTVLLAAFDLVSDRRMQEYGPQIEAAASAPELARLARLIYDDDLERGYVSALGEMVAGGVSDPVLGAEVAARIEPWIEMVEHKLATLLEGSALLPVIAPRELAFGIIATYFGVDMLSHLQQDRSRADSLLELAERLADLANTVLLGPLHEAP
ncbi:MAG: TetR/AcrR family transcriptional regulator [Solirubrobacteraceae bacterium]